MDVIAEIEIRGEMIRLGQLLKLADMVEGGGGVKEFLATEDVLVNGEPENRRGRQLRDGDVIRAVGRELRIAAGG